MREVARRNSKLPQAVEARRRHCQESRLWEIGHAHIKARPEIRKRAGRRQSATKMAWCPHDMREDYRTLVYVKKVSAAEARAMILEEHERRMDAFTARLEATA